MKLKQLALELATGLYGVPVSFRMWLYDQSFLQVYHSNLPVISVGNLTVGGNGKTPLCMYLVKHLQAHGFKPVILSRGYGGSLRGPYRVREGDSPQQVGDEPLLLARLTGVPVYIARKRAAGARCIEKDQAGDLIILDDGFQHRALFRNIDILSAFVGNDEAIEGFLKGELLPMGRFREDRDTALKRAQVLILAERRIFLPQEGPPPPDRRLLDLVPPHIKIFRSYLEPLGVRRLSDDSELLPQPVIAVAGVAEPGGFFSSLEKLGFQLIDKKIFPDHHPFVPAELDMLRRKHQGIPLVCTEKDAVKIALQPELRPAFWSLRVALKVIPKDAFLVHIVRTLRSEAT